MAVDKEFIEDQEYIVGLRRYFHQYPELSMQEFKTADKIEEELEKVGITHKRVGQTGVLGIIKGNGTSEKIVALRADIDALRIQDQKTVAYKSKNQGVMHACGHDSHIASLLGAARYLKKHEEKLAATVYLFFQPGEEYGKGASDFIEAGLADHLYRVYGAHAASDVPAGQVALASGPVNASVDHFTINIKGKSAHVSTPEAGLDALYIASQIVVALQAITTRMTNPMDTVLIGIGVLKAGDAYNIVAKDAVIEGTTRCFKKELRSLINQKISETAETIAKLYGGSASIAFESFTDALINDETAYEEAKQIAEEIVGTEQVINRKPSLAGDNFADFLGKAKGVYAYIGTRNPAYPDTCVPQHGDTYDIDEKSLVISANLYAAYAMSIK